METFVADGVMPEALAFDVMTLRLMPCVERTIEREHRPLNKAARAKATHLGSAFSCAARSDQLVRDVLADFPY